MSPHRASHPCDHVAMQTLQPLKSCWSLLDFSAWSWDVRPPASSPPVWLESRLERTTFVKGDNDLPRSLDSAHREVTGGSRPGARGRRPQCRATRQPRVTRLPRGQGARRRRPGRRRRTVTEWRSLETSMKSTDRRHTQGAVGGLVPRSPGSVQNEASRMDLRRVRSNRAPCNPTRHVLGWSIRPTAQSRAPAQPGGVPRCTAHRERPSCCDSACCAHTADTTGSTRHCRCTRSRWSGAVAPVVASGRRGRSGHLWRRTRSASFTDSRAIVRAPPRNVKSVNFASATLEGACRSGKNCQIRLTPR